MKKFVLIMTVGFAVCALTGFVGCSDDDEDQILGPGASDTAAVDLFMSEFDDMGEVNGEMLGFTMGFIDSIMALGGAGKVAAGAEAHILLTYHDASQYWYCTALDSSDEDNEVFYFVDSLQFRHGSTPVQWPVDTLLTEVRSYMRLTVTGDNIDTATAWQNVVLTADNPQSDTLSVSGTGGLLVELSEMDIDYTDTTICEVDFDLGFVYTELVFDMSAADEDGPGCPRSGTLAASGSVAITCTGADEGSVSGTFGVTQVFDDGTVTTTVQYGGFTFKGTDTCD